MHLLFTILASSLCLVSGDRTSQIIYFQVAHHGMCFRRLNATNQIGCASAMGGNVGVLHYIENEADKEWLVQKGPHNPYIVLLTPQMFTRGMTEDLRKSGKINGIMVINSKNDTNDFVKDVKNVFSPDRKCPNEFQSMYLDDPTYGHCKNTTWNPQASALMYENYEFPIATLPNTTEIDFLIHNCYEAFNKPTNDVAKTYPLCSVEMKSAMDAAVDTPTCIRRSKIVNNLNPQQYCDPLGNYNVHSTLHPINKTDKLEDNSVIIIAARLDAGSMFEMYPGVDSTLTGLVTVLAAAEAIGKVKQQIPKESSKHILFALFNGESFDYIGSSRVVYDMINGKFPQKLDDDEPGPHSINLTHIHSIIEVSQVGLPEGGKLYIHTDPLSQKTPSIKTMVDQIANATRTNGAASGLDLTFTPEVQPLPPASLQSFLKKAKIPGIVVADHMSKYSNRFYNSRLDLPSLINMTYDGVPEEDQYDFVTSAAEHITKVASAVAKTVYQLATDSSDTDLVEASNKTVTHLMYCFAKGAGCELFNYTLEPDNSKKLSPGMPPFSLYVGVRQTGSTTVDFRTHVARNILSSYLGDTVNLTKSKCTNDEQKDKLYNFVYVSGAVNTSSPTQARLGLCLKSTTSITEAKSPAFDIPDYDWSSNEYSAWTESRWANGAFHVRAFLVPSRTQEVIVLCVGIGLFLVSMVLAYLASKKGHMVFGRLRAASTTSCDDEEQ